MDFPAKKGDLIQHAKENKADQNIIDILNDIPEKEYKTRLELNQQIGEDQGEPPYKK